MPNPSHRKRTAVLVVHGMGSQRPLDTVRGVVDAVWLGGNNSTHGTKKIWTHPELSGVDIDLSVITTSAIPNTDRRVVDFHELYWAHLMSETRAVAVLLWLFELARKGPFLKPSIGPLYWGALIFLALLVLSASLIAIQFTVQFIQLVARFAEPQYSSAADSHSLIFVFLTVVIAASCFAFVVSIWKRAFRLAGWSLAAAALSAAAFLAMMMLESLAECLTNVLLPTLVAALAIGFMMGRWGIVGLGIVLALSGAALLFVMNYFGLDFQSVLSAGKVPWSITSSWSSAAAWYFIAMYFALYAAFLQPYLGDAARYFRDSPGNVAVRREIRKQAVETLEALHLSGDYDRIVVVAHSLGTVIAYDMLRAYYGRICDNLPAPPTLGPDVEIVDQQRPGREEAREKGRAIIAAIERAVPSCRRELAADPPRHGDHGLKAWLVTDFVTMGSPLTHAHYLMCDGKTKDELDKDFERRARERQFPTCPPRNLNGDGWLTFENPNDHLRHFHHGGQFALTRWTNLYFPVSQLLWGDAIGGPVVPVFGKNVVDLPVYENNAKRDSFFAHILYWTLPRDTGSNAPHIVALQNAIDLADTGIVNRLC
jgi:hypothetical protein